MSEPTVDREPFEVVAESFLARYRAGERPSIEEYAVRHPELADQIRKLLPALVMVEQGVTIDDDLGSNGERPLLAPSAGKERRLGDYRILREIGRGGMGVVYEAEQVSLGRRVALKVLPGQVSRDRLVEERFRREAKAAARLHHTNIVPVFDVGQDGDVRFYAMQFIQGMGLDAVIIELRRLRERGGSHDNIKPVVDSLAHAVDRNTRQDIEAPTLGEGVEVSAVLQYILTGRLDPGSQSPELVGASPSMLARALAGGLATPTGTGTERRSAGFDPGRTQTETESATAGDATGPQRPYPPAPALLSSTPTTSSSAILPGGAQLSSAESGRRAFFRSLAQIGRQVAGGLAYAHARGVVHRDIKPSNLLLDTEGVVWIADFGLAKGEDEGLTQSGDILGTLRYMAPERFRGQGDARADVYALGLTLYELLTLRPGFDSLDRLKLIEQIKAEEPQRPRAIDARIPRDLETIVLKAIEKDPKARYQSAQAMGADLQRFLADEPIKARQVSAAERYWRWARRNPLIAVLGGVLTAVLVATTVGSILAASYFRDLAGSESRANQQSQEDRRAAIAAEQVAILERDKAQRNEEAERWGRYRSNIAAASAALQLQNSDAARSALEDAPEEHRNWEWRHVHSQLDSASLVVPVPGGKIRSLVLSPSGRQIAVQCDDQNQVYLYDVATGRLDGVLRGYSAPASSVAYRRYLFAPPTSVAYRPDGQQVATSGNDQTIRLWDSATGRQMALLKAKVAPPNLDRDPGVAYNSDGSRIASSHGGGGTSRLWDTTTGKEIAVLAKWEPRGLAAAFSPDGKRVAVGSREYVHLCDALTGRQLAVLGPHPGKVGRLAYSPDGKRIASEGGSSAVYLWDGESGKEVAVLIGHTGMIGSVLFSPDGTRLVSESDYPDNTARLWDAVTGRLVAVLAGHQGDIRKVAFSPDGKRVATVSMDQTGRLWDGRTGESLAVLRGHTNVVQQVLFNPNGTRVMTGSYDGTLRLWNAQRGDLVGVLRVPESHDLDAPAFTPDGSRLVSACADGAVRIWDMRLVELNGILRGHESYVYDVAFSPNGEQVASAGWDGTARLWDATTGRQTGLLKHETGILNSVAYSRDGRQLATVERERGVTFWDVASQKAVRTWRFPAGYWAADPRATFNPAGTLLAAGCLEGPVRLWDVPGGQEIAELKGHVRVSVDVAFHPDGHMLATGGEDGTVGLWDVATRAPLAILRVHAGIVWRVLFSADGKLLASGSSDKTIRLWDTRTHEQLAVTPVGSIVYGLAFSPDGTRLAAGCADSTIRLIDVATRQEVVNLRGHTDYVHAVAWSPDGTRLVSGSGDFTVRIWDALAPAERIQRSEAPHPTR